MKVAWLLVGLTAACGGGGNAAGDIPRPKGEPVPQAAANAESAGSDPVPTSFRSGGPAPTSTGKQPLIPRTPKPPAPPTGTPM